MYKCVAVLTSGGDGPGLNPCIRAVVCSALDHKPTVKGVRRGMVGLTPLEETVAFQWELNLELYALAMMMAQ
jgi:6-phosphofructokinase